jgi:hypothetical protein
MRNLLIRMKDAAPGSADEDAVARTIVERLKESAGGVAGAVAAPRPDQPARVETQGMTQ